VRAETPIRVSFFFAAFFRAAQLSLDLPGKNCYDTVKIKLAPKELERAMIKKELTSRKKQAMEMRSRIQAVALELFQDSNNYVSEHHVTWHNMGVCCFYLQQYEKAIYCFQKVGEEET